MNIFFNGCILLMTLGLASIPTHNFNAFSNNQLNFSLNEIEEIYEEGYLRLKKQNQAHTQEIGLPELPIYSTLYMVNPNKNYDFDIIVYDTYKSCN